MADFVPTSHYVQSTLLQPFDLGLRYITSMERSKPPFRSMHDTQVYGSIFKVCFVLTKIPLFHSTSFLSVFTFCHNYTADYDCLQSNSTVLLRINMSLFMRQKYFQSCCVLLTSCHQLVVYQLADSQPLELQGFIGSIWENSLQPLVGGC